MTPQQIVGWVFALIALIILVWFGLQLIDHLDAAKVAVNSI